MMPSTNPIGLDVQHFLWPVLNSCGFVQPNSQVLIELTPTCGVVYWHKRVNYTSCARAHIDTVNHAFQKYFKY